MQSVIGALRVNLGIDTAVFQDGLRNVEKSLKGVGRRFKSVGQDLSLSLTAPIAGFAALTIRTAGDFEASMNRVGAATGAAEETLAELREEAKRLGRETQFSASEAADAIEILAKNGLDASAILGGALDASLTLAAASGADLAAAGDLATDVMLNFGKGAGDLKDVVDGVSGVLLQSKFDFDDYRLALAQAGGVAGGLGVPLEEFNAVIAATSSAFASGSDAGTSFKTFLQRLVPQSKEARAAMEQLGVQFFNADGSMKAMGEVAQELQDGLRGLSDEEVSGALTKIFGTDAMRTAIGLAREGADGIREIGTAIGEASATEQAEARMKGFNGAMKRLASAFEALQLAIADSGLLDFVTGFVQKLADFIAGLSESDPKILKWGTVIAGLVAVVGPAAIAIGSVVAAIGAIGVPIVAAVAAVGTLTAAVVKFWPEIKQAGKAVAEFTVGALEDIVAFAEQMGEAIFALPGQFMEIGGAILDGLWAGLTSGFAAVRDGLTGFATGLVGDVKSMLGIRSPSTVFAEIGEDMMEGLRIGVQTGAPGVTREIDGLAADLESPLRGAFDGAGNALADFVTKGKADFGSLVDSLVADITRLAIQSAIVQPLMNALGGIGGGVGGGSAPGLFGGGGLLSLFGFADGAAFLGGKVTAFARGGVVSGPTMFPMTGGVGLMGEAGDEAILPLERGRGGKLGVNASGAGGVTVVMNITTRDADSFRRSEAQIAGSAGRAIDRATRRNG